MNLIPWRKRHGPAVRHEPRASHTFLEFRRELDRLFDRFSRGGWLGTWDWPETEWTTGQLVPLVDIAENDKKVTIRAEVPGMRPEDIDIKISGNVLTIHGEKKETTEETKDDYYHCERHFGSFTRSVELPVTANLEDVEAEQRNGVLTITVTKIPAEKARKIPVKTTERQLAGTTT